MRWWWLCESFLVISVETWVGGLHRSPLIHDSLKAIIEIFINNFFSNLFLSSSLLQIKIRMWKIGEWEDRNAETLCNGKWSENRVEIRLLEIDKFTNPNQPHQLWISNGLCTFWQQRMKHPTVERRRIFSSFFSPPPQSKKLFVS